MSGTTSITLPTDLAERLQQQAKAMGLSVSTYLLMLEKERQRSADPQFNQAVKFLFNKYPDTMRKLAQ